ncbi:hypothetical protein F3Y22_tig00110548pilonHSYRG00267 [Hibiscus syriacus]|uniref:SAP domain-containing protein n=1 Tax=Hibiscus syriacus TaxID=106335 RepID=A0A6A3AE23_HIBSY|nr:dentin sialophosphoprotein-like [Hibiscus syriacus]KAE8701119.1 hypothetical protein F3Y22_tig00110548pilonHSYRG00267 [Hibiscus syriacus]
MSSKFQILDNRPIDKWKVVELREELKRRHLTTRGLKKDLVRRLDAAVRTERKKAANEAANGFNNGDSQPVVEEGTEKVKEVDHGGFKLADDVTDYPAASGHGVVEKRDILVEGEHLQSSKLEENVNSSMKMVCQDPMVPEPKDDVIDDNVKISLDVVEPVMAELYSSTGSDHGVVEERDILVEDEPAIQNTVVKTVIPEVPLTGQHLQSSKQEEIVNSNMQTESRDRMPEVERRDPKARLENENQEDDIHKKVKDVGDDVGGENEECGLKFKDDISDCVATSGHGEIEESGMLVDDKAAVTEGPLIGEHLHSSKQEENVNSNLQTESRDQKLEEENGSPKLEMESDDPKAQLETENQEDDMHKKVEDVVDHGGGEIEKGCGLKFKDDISDYVAASGHGVVEEIDIVAENKPVVTEVPLIGEHLQSSKQEENVKSNMQTESQNLEVESDDPKTRIENENQQDDIHKNVKDIGDRIGGENKECELTIKNDISDCVAESGYGVIEESDMLVDDKASVTEVPLTGEHLQSLKQEENVNSNMQMESPDRNLEVKNGSSKLEEESDDHKAQLVNDNQEDNMHKKVEDVVDHGDSENECTLKLKDDISDFVAASVHGVVEESDMLVEDKPLVTEVPLIGEHLQRSKQEENTNSRTQMECQDGKPPVENESPKVEAETDDPKAQLENGDDMHDASSLNNQLPEINQISGFQAKSDSMSISEKIELKDNLIDDNAKLSQDVVKQEMVGPCSYSNVVPDNGESHSMDDKQPLENTTSVDDERDDKNDTSTADTSNTDDSGEMVFSEKLDFDRSLSDDSMDEDLPETKQSDSQCSTDEIGEDSEENEALIIKELEIHVARDGSPTYKHDIFIDNKSHSSIPAKKRKLQDEEAMENNEPPKRHTWNSDAFTLTNTPKGTMQLAASRSNSSSSDSTDSEDTTREQDVEEAMETRNAIYNLQWPPNGGRLLVADFVDPHEVETLTSESQPSELINRFHRRCLLQRNQVRLCSP